MTLARMTMLIGAVALAGCAGPAVERPSVKREEPSFNRAVARGEALYLHYCAPCHGERGRGDGPNYPPHLQPRPTALSDKAYMDAKADEELFEATSRFFGRTLEPQEISDIVRFLRTLSASQQGGGSR